MRNGTRTLLLALTRMQEILIANSVQHAQQQDLSATLDARISALGREISAMEEVYSSIFENIDELNFEQEMLQCKENI